MNVIVSNKYQTMLDNLGIDIIKNMNGEFEVDEIISTFQTFFYQRMILDITAIKDYKDIRNLQKLSISLDMDKVILLLDDSSESSTPAYLSKLISMGIYNFTRNIEGIQYLYNHPNSYRDVAQFHQLDNVVEVEQPAPVAPQTAPVAPVQQIYYSSQPQRETKSQPIVRSKEPPRSEHSHIIGVKNVTKSSGATTLVYMMFNELSRNYNVAAIEVDKTDFSYLNDNSLISAISGTIMQEVSKVSTADVILIDVNNSIQAESLCNEIIYIIEPTTIKLNKLMMVTPQSLKKLKGKRVILNQSLLSSKDVMDFEYESRLKIFYNMPPLDEREKKNKTMNDFLIRLGFDLQAR